MPGPGAPRRTQAFIAGVGFVLPEIHWTGAAAEDQAVRALAPSFAGVPLACRDAAEPDFERQIPKPGDRRAMGRQFLFGAYAAGEALAEAGLDDLEARRSTGIFVATRLGERSEDVDAKIFADCTTDPEAEARRNHLLMTSLRPTLFLAQIPNLLAGNIAMVHDVKGESRTFIGEEMAGVNALHMGVSSLVAGRLPRVLVGGALNASRESLLRWNAAAFTPEGAAGGRPAPLATASAFLLLESEAAHRDRGGNGGVTLSLIARLLLGAHASPGEALINVLEPAWRSLQESARASTLVLSNAPFARHAVDARAALARLPDPPARVMFTSDLVGSCLEADAPMQVGLAARLLAGWAGADGAQALADIQRVLVITRDHSSGLGVFLVERGENG
jgi:3-oxoacyl-[acyl-carrier-protein] synthase II